MRRRWVAGLGGRSLLRAAVPTVVAVVLSGAVAAPAASPPSGPLDLGDGWRYLVTGADAPPAWQSWDFDDTAWSGGSGPFGYGDRPLGTALAKLAVPGAVLLLRRELTLPESARVTQVIFELASDGPFAVYVNGVEVMRSPRPLPGRIDPASGDVKGVSFRLEGVVDELLPGRNVVAVEVVNRDADPVGFFVAPRLAVTIGERWRSDHASAGAAERVGPPRPLPKLDGGAVKHVLLMISDGWGPLHIDAANQYLGEVPEYQLGGGWHSLWMSTFPVHGSYDPALAWSDFTYPIQGATDSAAAATAMYAGLKTGNGRISVDAAATRRLDTIGERARRLGMVVGAVTTVQVAHATAGAFTSHNLARSNGYAIGDEAFFGDPNTTGTIDDDPRYAGGFGRTLPPSSVLVGDRASSYLAPAQRDKLAAESGLPGKHCLVEGETGVDGGAALLAAAADPGCRMLAGLFDRSNLRATAPGWNYRLETPSLAESTEAALTVLGRTANGFVLMVEGGAVDWGAQANDMDRVIGEMRDFNLAVQAAVDWVEEPANGSGWENTLVVVAGDHETGYLTRAPGVFPNELFAPGDVSAATLALEKVDVATGLRASWIDDAPANNQIDPGEVVFWSWNSAGHSNTLVPVFARGVGAEQLELLALGEDPVRGSYIDNTDVFGIVAAALATAEAIFVDGFEGGDAGAWSAVPG